MNNSILSDIKKLIGLTDEYDCFDTDLIIHINSAISVLKQLGVGKKAFRITGYDECWDELLDGVEELDFVKTYIYLKCRLVFDPPTNGSVLEAIKSEIKEYEWRAAVEADEVPLNESEVLDDICGYFSNN